MKQLKKLVSLLLSAILLFSVTVAGVSAKESVVYKQIPLDSTAVAGEFKSTNETHYYTFTLEETSRFNFNYYHKSNSGVLVFGLLYMDGIDYPVLKINRRVNDDSTRISDMFLEKGTYYLHLTAEAPCEYEIRSYFIQVKNDEIEPNNHNTLAQKIQENQPVLGAVTLTDRIDVYEFTLKKRSNVKFRLWGNDGLNLRPADGMSHTNNYCYSRVRYEDSDDDLYEVNGWENGYECYVLDAGSYYVSFGSSDYWSGKIYKWSYETSEPSPVFVEYGIYRGGKTDITSKGFTKLSVIDGKVKKWSVSDKKIIKITELSGKSVRVWGLQKGEAYVVGYLDNGKQVKCRVMVTTNPQITKGNKKVKSVKIKKGKTVTVKVENTQAQIKNTYQDSKYAKVVSYKNGKMKIKGKKVGTSYVKIKANGVKTLKLKVVVTK